MHFRDFLARFPKSKLAGNAQYWLGESYYDLREYPASLEEFNKVVKRYPKSRKVPDAYYKRGLTYLRMKDPRRAALEYEKLIENYPKHRLFEKTQKNALISLPRRFRKTQVTFSISYILSGLELFRPLFFSPPPTLAG